MTVTDLPLVRDLSVVAGETFVQEFTWTDDAGNAVDLTGWTGQFVWGLVLTPELTLPSGAAVSDPDGGVELGGTDGTITITLESDFTSNMANSSNGAYGGVQVFAGSEWPPYQYLVKLTDPDGKVTVYVAGLLLVQKMLRAI